MASMELKTITTESYVLTLSDREAAVLKTIVGSMNGNKEAKAIYYALSGIASHDKINSEMTALGIIRLSEVDDLF